MRSVLIAIASVVAVLPAHATPPAPPSKALQARVVERDVPPAGSGVLAAYVRYAVVEDGGGRRTTLYQLYMGAGDRLADIGGHCDFRYRMQAIEWADPRTHQPMTVPVIDTFTCDAAPASPTR